MAKGRRLALFKIKQRGQSILQTPQRTLATEAHILGSRAACLVLFLSKGHVCPFLCHSRWLPGLPTTAVWTMDNAFIPGLAKGEGGHARHGPVPIFLLFPAFGRHLKRRSWGWLGWQCQDLASLPSISKQISFFENTEGNPVEKETLWAPGMLQKLAHGPNCGHFSVRVM